MSRSIWIVISDTIVGIFLWNFVGVEFEVSEGKFCSSSSLYSPLFMYIYQSELKSQHKLIQLCAGSFNMPVIGAMYVVFTFSF